jgi:hypothetical protein
MLSSSVHAQDEGVNATMGKKLLERRRQNKMNALYEKQVKSIYSRDQNAEKSLYTIRSFYPYTSQYDPFPDKLEEEIMRLSYEVENAETPEDEREALLDYNAFVSSHLANIDVLYWAISLAKQDVRFGNVSFYRWVRKKLIDSIFDIPSSTSQQAKVPRRDGRSLTNALHIVTFGEENVILGRVGGEVLSTDLRTQESSIYQYINIHEIRDSKTGKTYYLYVNVSIPLDSSLTDYERRKLEEERALTKRGG